MSEHDATAIKDYERRLLERLHGHAGLTLEWLAGGTDPYYQQIVARWLASLCDRGLARRVEGARPAAWLRTPEGTAALGEPGDEPAGDTDAAPDPVALDAHARMAADIRAIRESSGCSLHEARRIALRRRLRDAVNAARTAEDLRPVLHALIGEVLV